VRLTQSRQSFGDPFVSADSGSKPTDGAAFTVECLGKTTREINQSIREAVARGISKVTLNDPSARHNLAVALPESLEVVVEGSAGYYVAGLNDGATVRVRGSAGWGAAESMRTGIVEIEADAGNAVAASIRDGTVIVRGNVSTRAGIAMKGGLLIVAGNAGPMAGFMMQKGTMIICGNAGDGVADCMYAGTIFVGGNTGELGSDAVFEEISEADRQMVAASLEQWRVTPPALGFRKLVAGRRLWNFQKSERDLWKAAL
jgi:methylamine---glutamate N-methyltransferase subunit B